MQAPIIIIGFARPDYLDRVLLSIAQQKDCDISARAIAFFQDGAVSEQSGKRYASDADIEASAAVFRRHFPSAPIFQSQKNLGICGNFDRAEYYAFEELGAEVAYFFEDDLVLTPRYIAAMDQIREDVEGIDQIAYFSAYGDRFAGKEFQEQNQRAVMPMRHNWAFGLKRPHWREMRAFLKPYYDLILAGDYHDRDHHAVWEWYRSLGYVHEATSQDGAKALATNLLGKFRLLTVASFAEYIGATGTHTTPEVFVKHGYADAEIYGGPFQGVDVPDSNDLERMILAERAVYQANFEGFKEPERAIAVTTRTDVIAAYHLFLGREPESEDVINARIGVPLSVTIESFARSGEYRRRIGQQ